MGFYGKVTNSSKTQFSFDRIYPSRHAMDLAAAADGVFIGRYVLVEYDYDGKNQNDSVTGDSYPVAYIKSLENVTVSSENNNLITIAQLQVASDKTDDRLDFNPIEGQICQVYADGSDGHYNVTTYWIGDTTRGGWRKVVSTDSLYLANYTIDIDDYGESRGYDSTVWTKVYRNDKVQYVMVAELNSVVPSFDLTADAPTNSPMIPHFDADSTNVYYKLHVQPNWGFRVHKATTPSVYNVDNTTGEIVKRIANTPAEEKENYPSDEAIVLCRDEYDKTNGKLRHYYYSKYDKWEEYDPAKVDMMSAESRDLYGLEAAIYFNKEGFDPAYNHYSWDEQNADLVYDKVNQKDINSINLTGSGRSGHDYAVGSDVENYAHDIQELSIMLPSVGNAIAKVWDLVYGDIEQNQIYNEKGEKVNNTEDTYVAVNVTERDFEKLKEKLSKLSAETKYKRLYYKLGEDNYKRLGTSPVFNQNLKYYMLVQRPKRDMSVKWASGEATLIDKVEPEGLRLINRDPDGNGWTYDKEKVETVAGAINSVHDLMGMVIIDKNNVNQDTILASLDEAIYYYDGDDTSLIPITEEGEVFPADRMLKRNADGTVDNKVPYIEGDNLRYPVQKGTYYRKAKGYAFVEEDTSDWTDIEKIPPNYQMAGSKQDGNLIDFGSSDLFYRMLGASDDYYNYYKVDADAKFDADKYYLAKFDAAIKENKANLTGVYKPEVYWKRSTENHYVLDSSVSMSNKQYFFFDSYTSGDLYVPGLYYYTEGDAWVGTYNEGHSTGNGYTSGGPVDIVRNGLLDAKDFYGIDYNSSRARYVTEIVDGKVQLVKKVTYKIDKTQPVKLIDYNNVYRVTTDDYAYAPVQTTSSSDIRSYITSNGTVYFDDPDKPGYLLAVDPNNISYDPKVQYYVARWNSEGVYVSDTERGSVGYCDYQEDYQPNMFFTERYKPINLVREDYVRDEYDEKTNKYTTKLVGGNYEEVVKANCLYYIDIAKAEKVDFKAKTDPAYYEPYTYFYIAPDDNGNVPEFSKEHLEDIHFVLSITPTYDSETTYYKVPMVKVSEDDLYSEEKHYYIYGMVLANEPECVPYRKYYRQVELTKMDAVDLFESEGTTITLFCSESGDFAHYRLTPSAALSVFINIPDGNLKPQKLYKPRTYYYARPNSASAIAYIRDNTEEGNGQFELVRDTANHYSTSKDYFNKDGNEITVSADDYNPKEEYFIKVPNFANYYTWSASKDSTYHVISSDFYTPNTYYYEQDKNYYVENNITTVSSHKPYYKITPYYIVHDDLGAYGKGAEWNQNVIPVPVSLHIGKRKEYVYWQKLEGFGRTMNTIHGLILKMNSMLETGNAITRDTNTVQGCINKIQDIIAHFGAVIPGSFMIGDSYGRVKGAKYNSGQDDVITNYGKISTSSQRPVTTSKATINKRWLDVQVHNYYFQGIGYPSYEDAYKQMIAKNVVFGVLPSDINPVKRYYYSWDNMTEAEFNLHKAHLSTGVGAQNGDLFILTSVESANTYTPGTRYWYYCAVEANENYLEAGELYHRVLENNSEIVFKHTYSATNGDSSITSNLNTDRDETEVTKTAVNSAAGDAIKLFTPLVDKMGHIVGTNTETVTLPYGFKTVKVTNNADTVTDAVSEIAENGQIANNTQDTLTLSASNKWIKFDNKTNNTIKVGHIVNTINEEAVATTNLNSGTKSSQLTLYDTSYDEAGHIIAHKAHNYLLPYTYSTFSDGKNDSVATDSSYEKFTFSGDSWISATVSQDAIAFAHTGPVETTHTNVSNATPKFGSTFTITDLTFDDKGHKASQGTHTVKIPELSLTNGDGNVVTGLSLVAADGAFTETKANVGNLLLTDYSVTLPTSASQDAYADIAATDTINQAFGLLEQKIRRIELITENNNSIINDSENGILANAKSYTDTTIQNLALGTMSKENKDDYVAKTSTFVYNIDENSTITVAALVQKVYELEQRLALLENPPAVEEPEPTPGEEPEETM